MATIQGKHACSVCGLTARGQSIRQSTYFPSRLLPDTNCGSLKTKFLPARLVIAAGVIATLISGCAIADFTTYSGQQQNWPTQPGSFVATQYAIPVYIHSYPDKPYNVIGYLDATTAPIRRRGVVGFAARRAKELGADAIIVLAEGSEYAGTLTTGNASTNGNFYPGGFNATTTGTNVSVPLMLGKAQVIAIKWR